jgi:hypothetical protein
MLHLLIIQPAKLLQNLPLKSCRHFPFILDPFMPTFECFYQFVWMQLRFLSLQKADLLKEPLV